MSRTPVTIYFSFISLIRHLLPPDNILSKEFRMGTMSPIHWILVLLVIVLLFGVKKVPDLMKNLGIGINEFKKAMKEGEKVGDKEIPGTAAKTTTTTTPEKTEKKDDVKA
jgi:sec-independent protein translocase protein TatA